MQLILCLLSNLYLNTFRASLCPSSGEQDRVLLHMVFCNGCASCDCVELCAHSSTQSQLAQPLQNTICSNTRSCSPDDGHNDARNVLRYKFDNKQRISCISLFYLSSPRKSRNLFRFWLQLLAEPFVIVSSMERNIKKNILVFMSDFDETYIFWTCFRKKNHFKFTENPSIGSRLPCGRTDRHSQFYKRA